MGFGIGIGISLSVAGGRSHASRLPKDGTPTLDLDFTAQFDGPSLDLDFTTQSYRVVPVDPAILLGKYLIWS